MVAKGADVAALTLRLRSALQGLDRGLAIDADDDTMGSEEAEVGCACFLMLRMCVRVSFSNRIA